VNYQKLAGRMVAAVALGPGFLLTGLTTPPLAIADTSTSDPEIIDLAQVNIYPYLVRPTGQRADPINLLFVGTSDVTVVTAMTRDIFGWTVEDGGMMYFAQGGELRPHDAQLISPENLGLRFHVRLKSGVGYVAGQPFVLGAIHTDYPVRCGHVGRDFDSDRDLIAFHFNQRGIATTKASWGNTARVRHCNGELNAGDGLVAVIQLPSAYSR
jgi:hypothetical protein